jgi:hypothetical protein
MSGHSPSWSDHCGWFHWPPVTYGTSGVPRPPTLAFESPQRATDRRTSAIVVKHGLVRFETATCAEMNDIQDAVASSKPEGEP